MHIYFNISGYHRGAAVYGRHPITGSNEFKGLSYEHYPNFSPPIDKIIRNLESRGWSMAYLDRQKHRTILAMFKKRD